MQPSSMQGFRENYIKLAASLSTPVLTPNPPKRYNNSKRKKSIRRNSS